MTERFALLYQKLNTVQILILKGVVFLSPLVFLFGVVLLKLYARGWYRRLAIEDGPIETLTSLAYLIAFFIGIYIAFQLYKQKQSFYAVLYMLLSIGLLFIFLEEISWGQRIFNLETPQFFEVYNHQHETNLHNFAGRYLLHASYILVGAYGVFAFLLIPKIFPGKFSALVNVLAPNRFLIFYFLPVMGIYMYYDYLSPVLVAQFGAGFGWESGWNPKGFMIAKDQEVMEFLLALGFLLFVGINTWRQTLGEFDDLPELSFQKNNIPIMPRTR